MKTVLPVLSLTIIITSLLVGCGTNEGTVEEPVGDNPQAPIDQETDAIEDIEKIEEFELEIDYVNNDELDMDYKNRNGSTAAEVERKTADGKEEIKGDEALAEMENLIQQLTLHPNTTPEEALEQVLTSLNIQRDDIRKLELEVDFTTGEKLKANM
ncbi:YusW family protein [Halalkalibacter okhensis]|uniref:YusW-like protein n=1 Tax=Halalkalibacter okhensis TaxID=333138 RepID=A0A0B0IDH2_9BACI|nr:YusW family protein [Halalkalibacter okhensis]KHF40648.1 hypothetical protein LQ50_07515 [Halalkalibacter okhensis]